MCSGDPGWFEDKYQNPNFDSVFGQFYNNCGKMIFLNSVSDIYYSECPHSVGVQDHHISTSTRILNSS